MIERLHQHKWFSGFISSSDAINMVKNCGRHKVFWLENWSRSTYLDLLVMLSGWDAATQTANAFGGKTRENKSKQLSLSISLLHTHAHTHTHSERGSIHAKNKHLKVWEGIEVSWLGSFSQKPKKKEWNPRADTRVCFLSWISTAEGDPSSRSPASSFKGINTVFRISDMDKGFVMLSNNLK